MIPDSGLLFWATLYIGHFRGGNWLKGYKNKLHALLNCRRFNCASLGVLNTVSTISVTGKWWQVLILWFYSDWLWIMYNGSWVNFGVGHWVMGHKQWPIACFDRSLICNCLTCERACRSSSSSLTYLLALSIKSSSVNLVLLDLSDILKTSCIEYRRANSCCSL